SGPPRPDASALSGYQHGPPESRPSYFSCSLADKNRQIADVRQSFLLQNARIANRCDVTTEPLWQCPKGVNQKSRGNSIKRSPFRRAQSAHQSVDERR